MSTVEQPARRTQAVRREEAESRLLKAAVRLIAEQGLDGFKLAEVGAAAGYSRGLPLHYFGSKDKLLICVAEYLVQATYRTLSQHPEAPRGLPRLEQIICHYASRPVTSGTRALGVLISHARTQPSLRAAMQQLNADGLRMLEDELRAGVAAGNVRPDVDAPRTAQMIYSFLRGQFGFMDIDMEFDTLPVAQTFVRMLAADLRPVAGPSPAKPRAPAARSTIRRGTAKA